MFLRTIGYYVSKSQRVSHIHYLDRSVVHKRVTLLWKENPRSKFSHRRLFTYSFFKGFHSSIKLDFWLFWCSIKDQFQILQDSFSSRYSISLKQRCLQRLRTVHLLGNWAKFPEITTFSIKYVSFLALCWRFCLQTTFTYKSNIAELPANKNQCFPN